MLNNSKFKSLVENKTSDLLSNVINVVNAFKNNPHNLNTNITEAELNEILNEDLLERFKNNSIYSNVFKDFYTMLVLLGYDVNIVKVAPYDIFNSKQDLIDEFIKKQKDELDKYIKSLNSSPKDKVPTDKKDVENNKHDTTTNKKGVENHKHDPINKNDVNTCTFVTTNKNGKFDYYANINGKEFNVDSLNDFLDILDKNY